MNGFLWFWLLYFVDLLFLFFCDAHILAVGGTGGSAAPGYSLYSHHCLVSLTQVRFWSLAPLQKKGETSLKRWDREKDCTTTFAGFWGVIFKPEVLSDSPVFKVYSGVRKILPYVHQRQKSGFLREKGTCLGPLAWWAPPCLGGDGGEPGKELPWRQSFPFLPSPPDGGWWTQGPAAAFSSGRRWVWWRNSAEVEITAGSPILWKSLLLKKITKEKRCNWKWYALPGIFASLALIRNKGKRTEKRQPLTMLEDCLDVRKARGKPNPRQGQFLSVFDNCWCISIPLLNHPLKQYSE